MQKTVMTRRAYDGVRTDLDDQNPKQSPIPNDSQKLGSEGAP
jgi:hypothetical protein